MIYYLDTEVYKNYFLLVLLPDDGGQPLVREIHNDIVLQDDLSELDWAAHSFVTFNGTGYDLPIIAAHNAQWRNAQLKALSDQIIVQNKPWWEIYRENTFTQLVLDHVDISNVLPGIASLKLYGGRINAPTLQDLPLDPATLIEDAHLELMRKYCINDCQLTRQLFYSIKPQIGLRARLGRKYNVDIKSKSDAQIAEVVLSKEYQRITGAWLDNPVPPPSKLRYTPPDYVKFQNTHLDNMLMRICALDFGLKGSGHVAEPEGLSQVIELDGMRYKLGLGGLHSVDAPGSFYSDDNYVVLDIDVASYYPSLILNSGYAPGNMKEEFPVIYRDLVDQRLSAKQAGDKVTADTLKITINGSFGKLGSKYSKLYAPHLLMNVTLSGQLSLLMLIEELRGMVISANTDGIMVRVSRGLLPNIKARVADWERATKLQMEWTEYKSVHRRDVNNYFAITTDGKVKTKGVFAPPGLAKNPAFPIIYKAIIKYYKDGTDIGTTIRGCEDITDFICLRTVKGGAVYHGKPLGKAVRWYRSMLSDSAIHYESNNNKVATSDCAVPVMVLPESLPLDIDYAWYIQEAQQLLEQIG